MPRLSLLLSVPLAIREKAAVAAQPSVGSGAEEPANLLSQVNQLNQAGKYAEAIPLPNAMPKSSRRATARKAPNTR